MDPRDEARLERSADEGDLAARTALLRSTARRGDTGRFEALWSTCPDVDWRLARALEHTAMLERLYPGMAWVPPGRFVRGSALDEVGRFADEHLHQVELTGALLVSRTPVTQRQWLDTMGNNPSLAGGPRGTSTRQAELPVEHISWYDAVAYCNARSIREGLTPAYRLDEVVGQPGTLGFMADVELVGLDVDGYRLPTEAEWEYFCRAGTTTATWRGELGGPVVDAQLDEIAWYAANSGGTTHDVATRAANPWGLHDVHGLVWEWCQDGYAPYPEPRHDEGAGRCLRDPIGGGQGRRLSEPATGGDQLAHDLADSWRIVRGGCWLSQARFCRAAMRGYHVPGARTPAGSQESFGLRTVRRAAR